MRYSYEGWSNEWDGLTRGALMKRSSLIRGVVSKRDGPIKGVVPIEVVS